MARNRSVRYVDLGYTSARQWWEETGLPAHQRFVEQGNRQTAIDACLHAWHVHEWHWHEMNPGSDTHGNSAYLAYRETIVDACPELEWVRDVADASKHRGLGRPGNVAGVHDQAQALITFGNTLVTFAGRPLSYGVGVTLELTDGTKPLLSDVLATVVNFWNERLGCAPAAGSVPL